VAESCIEEIFGPAFRGGIASLKKKDVELLGTEEEFLRQSDFGSSEERKKGERLAIKQGKAYGMAPAYPKKRTTARLTVCNNVSSGNRNEKSLFGEPPYESKMKLRWIGGFQEKGGPRSKHDRPFRGAKKRGECGSASRDHLRGNPKVLDGS